MEGVLLEVTKEQQINLNKHWMVKIWSWTITIAGRSEAIKDLKNGKNPGIGKIIAELIKIGGPYVEAFYHHLSSCSKIWKEKVWPAD